MPRAGRDSSSPEENKAFRHNRKDVETSNQGESSSPSFTGGIKQGRNDQTSNDVKKHYVFFDLPKSKSLVGIVSTSVSNDAVAKPRVATIHNPHWDDYEKQNLQSDDVLVLDYEKVQEPVSRLELCWPTSPERESASSPASPFVKMPRNIFNFDTSRNLEQARKDAENSYGEGGTGPRVTVITKQKAPTEEKAIKSSKKEDNTNLLPRIGQTSPVASEEIKHRLRSKILNKIKSSPQTKGGAEKDPREKSPAKRKRVPRQPDPEQIAALHAVKKRLFDVPLLMEIVWATRLPSPVPTRHAFRLWPTKTKAGLDAIETFQGVQLPEIDTSFSKETTTYVIRNVSETSDLVWYVKDYKPFLKEHDYDLCPNVKIVRRSDASRYTGLSATDDRTTTFVDCSNLPELRENPPQSTHSGGAAGPISKLRLCIS